MLVAAIALAGAISGCGSDNETSAQPPRLTVSAAASLKDAFDAYARTLDEARARFSFAGSDELAAQIRRGVKPDVYAAANTRLPDVLFDEGLVERPVEFAGNRLVLAVPAGSERVRSLDDLSEPGVKLVVGAASVPVGSYTREVLARLPRGPERAILANVRSNESDVKGVVAKLAQGAADAGFVYVTDVKAAGGRLEAIELPTNLRPSVAYAAAVVKGSEEPALAADFIEGLLDGEGLAAMRAAGFEPPPS